jgi:L-2-hydroxyglutarate oxidase
VNQSGDLLHDFEFVKSARTLHVGNAPSPAATSAIPIAQNIVEQV